MKRVLAALLCASCGVSSTGRGPGYEAAAIPVDVVATAAQGVGDERLRDLLARQWDFAVRRNPTWASHLGDHRFDAEVGDVGPAGAAAARVATHAFLAEAHALDPAGLSETDRTTLALLVEMLAAEAGMDECAPETWRVSARENALVWAGELPDDLVVTTVDDGENLVARYRKLSSVIDGMAANLRLGAAAGKTASAEVLRRTVALLDGELAHATRQWGLYDAAVHWHTGWTAGDEVSFAGKIEIAIEEAVRPALQRYRDVLASEVLPRAQRAEGLAAMPGGPGCYRALIRYHTTLDRSPEELHALGLAEIARIDGEVTALGARVLGTTSLVATLARLRSDRALLFDTREDILAVARHALARAQAAVPGFFGIQPRALCDVRAMPAYEAPFSTTAYYREANADGSRPGTYMVNVYAPRTRVRYDAEALAFHESVPGHHLQIAVAQELGALPAFRRFWTWSAFTEGWGLYAEGLADEMKLYSSDLDRIGMLSFDAWRAARLVVDTGIHAMGWTRTQAVEFLLAHTALAKNNIENEVDRYIGDPAQALAYKVGQLEIVKLRREAEATLGAAFDVKGFHDAVLGGGGVTLRVLAERVRGWTAARKGARNLGSTVPGTSSSMP